jgi:hypothetical protein
VACISTPEHVGLDTRQFTGVDVRGAARESDFIAALYEMRRVLKPGGEMLLTVPFGRFRNVGTRQVFDARLLEQAIAAFEPGAVARTFFKYSQQGWQSAGAEDCRECEYVDGIMPPEKRRAEKFPVQPDGAAACVRLEKPVQSPQLEGEVPLKPKLEMIAS